MKKLVLLCVICLAALSMHAQRCAVLEFKAGVGISQDEVDGISAIFITYFRPAGYTMVERTQIDKAIDEQGFQRSRMTESQMVRIGQILNVSKIVVGDVNIVMGQYNVDARVINVETGTIAATEGATFSGSSYRTTMQNIAQKLASKIAIAPGATVPAQSNSIQQYVDLGLPSGTLWKSANEKGGFYSYDEAINKFGDKLPTMEQWEELRGMCTWSWTGKGYKVTGDNGNSITLPAAGIRGSNGGVFDVATNGCYWSSEPLEDDPDEVDVLFFYFDSEVMGTDIIERFKGLSVRLVQY